MKHWDSDWTSKYTSVSRQSKSGKLLRSYWHPILLSSEVPSRTQHKVELLGESLIIFRLANGRLGVLPEHCPHRGASLAYGFIEQEGIRCAYHGWKFSIDGSLLEAPFGNCLLNETCKAETVWKGKAYEVGGIIFVCLTPDDNDLNLPKWDLLLSGTDEIVVQRHEVNCNWFQYQENAADITHTLFLHGAKLRSLGIPDASGFYAQLIWYAFAIKPFGIIKAWLYENRQVGWGNLAVFPNILRIVEEMHWRVPITADRTLIFQVSGRSFNMKPSIENRAMFNLNKPLPAISIESPPIFSTNNNDYKFNLWSFQGQDAAACCSQGRFARREMEKLVTSDYGIALYRDIWQMICDENIGPNLAYKELLSTDDILDLDSWLGSNDIAISRPIFGQKSTSKFNWKDIFDGSEKLITVPRGSAGNGPLG